MRLPETGEHSCAAWARLNRDPSRSRRQGTLYHGWIDAASRGGNATGEFTRREVGRTRGLRDPQVWDPSARPEHEQRGIITTMTDDSTTASTEPAAHATVVVERVHL